jgi:REP element-mobilizing transposase RayT
MANTYHQINLQFIFAVKYRAALIKNTWKDLLCGVIGNLINEAGCRNLIVNAVEDHIHCFLGIKPAVSASDLMQKIKAKSSNDHNLTQRHFEWQEGFAVFSYSRSQVDKVFKYIHNQEEHHKKQTFQDEIKLFFKKFKIDFDEMYIFHEPI